MTKRDIIAQTRADFERRLEEKQRRRDERIEEVIARDPGLEALIYAGPTLLKKQAMLLTRDPSAAKESAKGLKAEAARCDSALRSRLKALGYGEDYLDIAYDCPLCRDKGYTETPVREDCACFVRAVNERLKTYAVDVTGSSQTFQSFDETVFPGDETLSNGRTQREQALLAKNVCQTYAMTYPDTDRLTLLLVGASGLGKTYLLNCVNNCLFERGYEPLRMTAFSLFEAMRAYHYGRDEGKGAFDHALHCDMLLIDDLGTEPMMQNITTEYLFTLMNERHAWRRHTMIATNLMPRQILERYGERVYSRLIDGSVSNVLPLYGRDLRKK